MINVLEGGLRATVRQFCRKQPKPPCVMRPASNGVLEESRQIVEVLMRCPTVVNLIGAAGAEKLWIIPFAGLSQPVATGAVTSGQVVKYAELGMREGEPILAVNPQTYPEFSRFDSHGLQIQHLLWYLFIGLAFPGFESDLVSLKRETAKIAPEFYGNLITPLFFFASQVAAMEARCQAFAVADSVARLLLCSEAGIAANANSLKNDRMKAAMFSGLLFAQVFGFELFSESKEIAGLNLQTIKEMMSAVMGGRQIREAEGLARTMLDEALIPGRDTDVRLTGFRGLIIQYYGGALRGGEEN